MEITKYIAKIILVIAGWTIFYAIVFSAAHYATRQAELLPEAYRSEMYAPLLVARYLVLGFIVEMIVAIIILPIQFMYMYKKGSGWKKSHLDRVQAETFKSKLDYDELFDGCQDAIRLLPAELTKVSEKKGRIEARTGLNITGLGERIVILVKKDGQVEVSSKAPNPLKVIDFGRSIYNVRSIASYVRRLSE